MIKKMQEWVQDEIDGYISVLTNRRRKKELIKNPPQNKKISGHFFIASSDWSVKPQKITIPIMMNKPIAEIEDIAQRHDQGNMQTTIPYTIDQDVSIKGKTVDLLIPREQWKKIIFSTERKLSKYLVTSLKIV